MTRRAPLRLQSTRRDARHEGATRGPVRDEPSTRAGAERPWCVRRCPPRRGQGQNMIGCCRGSSGNHNGRGASAGGGRSSSSSSSNSSVPRTVGGRGRAQMRACLARAAKSDDVAASSNEPSPLSEELPPSAASPLRRPAVPVSCWRASPPLPPSKRSRCRRHL